MKKRILAIVLVLALVFTTLSGCGLVVDNEQRVQEQAVVTVGSGVNQQKVTKQELVNGVNAYSAYLQYGISVEQLMEFVTNNLTANRVAIYVAMENLPKLTEQKTTLVDRYDCYLTQEELAEIESQVDARISTDINDVEKTIIRKNLEDFKEMTARKTPSDYNYVTKIPVEFVGTDTRNAAREKFNRLLNANNSSYSKYRESLLVSLKQNKILEKYQELVENEKNATDDDVLARYNVIIETEKEKYTIDGSQYAAKLKAIQSAGGFSSDNYILYTNEIGYGFGLNLLIPFSDEQKEEYTQLEADWTTAQEKAKEGDTSVMTEEEYLARKQAIYNKITVKDLRESWLKLYGVDCELFDNIPFDGTVVPKKSEGSQILDDEGYYAYDEIKANETPIDTFLANLQATMDASKVESSSKYDMYSTNLAKKDDFLNLIWQYSSDPGSLGNEIGYVLNPNITESGYVKEFAEATADLAKMGAGNYVIVQTSFGIHIVLCTVAYNDAGVVSEYKPSEKTVEGTFSFDFYNDVNKSLKNNYYSNKIAAYRAGYEAAGEFVVRDEKQYKAVYDSLTAKK